MDFGIYSRTKIEHLTGIGYRKVLNILLALAGFLRVTYQQFNRGCLLLWQRIQTFCSGEREIVGSSFLWRSLLRFHLEMQDDADRPTREMDGARAKWKKRRTRRRAVSGKRC
jgi:hypothetical protein